MNIAIMSDSHDNWEKMKKAVQLANEHGCEILLHAGDLIAPPGIAILRKSNGNVHYVFGNNEGEKIGISREIDASLNVTLEGNEMDKEFEGLRIFMSHYPNISALAFKTGDYGLVVYGHDHLYDVQKNKTTIMVNPGEVCGYRTGISTFAVYDTETKEVERIVL
jgi:hypothetical protein